MAVRTNLMPYPSGETTLGWTARNGTSVQSDPLAYAGSSGVRLSRTGSSAQISAYFGSDANSNPNADSFPVVAGDIYTLSCYVYAQVGLPSVELLLVWQTATAYQAFVAGAPVAVSAGWNRVTVTGTVPAGAVKMGVELRTNAAVATGTAFVADAFLLEKAPTAGTYFDGSSVKAGYTYAWTGTANASTSTETPPRINLLPNPSFEVGATGWTPAPTISAVTLTGVGAGTKSASGVTASVTDRLPATAGLDYTGSGWFMVNSTATTRTASVTVRFFDAGGTELSPLTVAQTALQPNSVPERRSNTRTAPVGTATVALAYNVNAFTAIFVDGFLLEQSSSLGAYFDGSTVKTGFTYAWTGTPHASTSIESLDATGKTIASALSGAGSLSSNLAYTKRVSSALSGSGALTSALAYTKKINSTLSGSGTLSSILGGRAIRSVFSGSGTLTSALTQTKRIASSLSGSGTLTSTVPAPTTPAPDPVPIPAAQPLPPYLDKLSSFSVSTAAVPLNPADGAGSAPSVNAAYTKGADPEFMLGETNLLTNGAIGTYEGEVVKLGLSHGSDVATISMSTPLTLLNIDLHLFPFIDGVPGKWTAARAIDYWTQQCGLFYDKVPGECVAYASGFGHTDSYGATTRDRFYEKPASRNTTTQMVNGRSVRTLGTDASNKTALHEVKDGSVGVSANADECLVFSVGLGLNGSGRTGTVTWTFSDSSQTQHKVSLSATSSGSVTAKLNGSAIASASVPAGGTYRLTLSLQKDTSTTRRAKLTVHTDDLAGAGTLQHDGDYSTVASTMPGVLSLTSITHASSGGTGAEMTRWGTYLTVAGEHPMNLPAVQKALFQTGKDFGFVSGFEGNVWGLLNEFCSIARLEVQFLDRKLRVPRRSAALSFPGGNFSSFTVDRERREKYKQVAVMNKRSKAVDTDDAVLWRADSVYQLNTREVFETTVQTPHSILNVLNPVPVPEILPFPYKSGKGQYVVTGADGYIIAPKWWEDNGGKVEVALTGKEGEISIKITAPAIDSVRAPYRISEGAGDRPALYISGSGILNDPQEVHVGTGAKNAREGFDSVFESPFIAGVRETYETAMAMASRYSASAADVSFELPNSFGTPTGFGQYPSGSVFTDNERNYFIKDASQTHSRVTGNAVPHTTIGAYVASYPPGSTIADEKARHAGRTIKQFNIKPLRGATP